METAHDRETFATVKALFSNICSQRKCPADNKEINKLSNFMITICQQEGADPVETVEELAVWMNAPRTASEKKLVQIFIWKATGERFSGA